MSESKKRQNLVLTTVFVLSQALNKKQIEKILKKIGLQMPEKTKYKIRDGMYFDYFATKAVMS